MKLVEIVSKKLEIGAYEGTLVLSEKQKKTKVFFINQRLLNKFYFIK